jgi:hypothetical protein
VNWPPEVPLPGQGDNDHKGINGIATKHLKLLYRAMMTEGDAQLGVRRIANPTRSSTVPLVPGGQALYRMPVPRHEADMGEGPSRASPLQQPSSMMRFRASQSPEISLSRKRPRSREDGTSD